MKILNHKIELGTSVQLKMDIARLYTRSKIEVPVIIERGKEDGPCILLTGGIHGDEINGMEIVRQIIAKGLNKPERGMVICIPVVNVFGFINQTRAFPDGRDLNRVFPGSKTGSLASRFAYHVMTEVIPDVDYCIDYHTGGAQRFNFSQLRINGADKETVALAEAFDAPYIIHAKNKEQTFRESIVKLGKKVLLFEGGKSLNLNRTVTKSGVQGFINVMHHLGMRDYSTKITIPNKEKPAIIINDSKWIRAKHSGMYRSYVSAGEKVEKGTHLGSISDPFGNFEDVFKNPKAGYVLNANHTPVVNQGDALFHIGYE